VQPDQTGSEDLTNPGDAIRPGLSAFQLLDEFVHAARMCAPDQV
jgi:hypothetical protein